VGAGAECAAGTRHHDRAHLVVGVGAVERVDQLGLHRRRPRVQALGTVEGDGEDAIGDLVANLGEIHWEGSCRCLLPGLSRYQMVDTASILATLPCGVNYLLLRQGGIRDEPGSAGHTSRRWPAVRGPRHTEAVRLVRR